MDAVAFAYYFLMLAIGLKIIHMFYSHFKKKKNDRRGRGSGPSLSLFGREDTHSDEKPE